MSERRRLKSDVGRFAIVPLWLVLAVSDRAVRVFALLAAMFADREGVAWPSRQTIATHVGLVQAKTIDPALRELVAAGALKIRNRRSKSGDPDSNEYVLCYAKPGDQGDEQVSPEQGLPTSESGHTVVPIQGHKPDPLNQKERKAARRARAPRSKPAENLGVITKIVHEVLDCQQGIGFADLQEEVKGLCARRRIDYDSVTIGAAIDSAETQRKLRRGA